MPTQPESQLGMRIPLDLMERIEAAAKARGMSKRQFVIQALEAALWVPIAEAPR